ncbi:MAG: hypothetical protein R3F36_12160 [Candidatus Competibacteraceae bacterium]
MDGNPKSGIEGNILDILHILRLAPGTVLRAEDGDDPGAGRLQQIECVAQLGIDAGGWHTTPIRAPRTFSGKSLISTSRPVWTRDIGTIAPRRFRERRF